MLNHNDRGSGDPFTLSPECWKVWGHYTGKRGEQIPVLKGPFGSWVDNGIGGYERKECLPSLTATGLQVTQRKEQDGKRRLS